MRSSMRVVAAALLVGGLAVACGDDDEESVAPATGSTAAPTTGDATAPTTGDATAPTTGDATAPTTGDATAPTTVSGVGNQACIGSDLVTDGIDREATIKYAIFGPLVTADPHAVGARPSAPYHNLMYDRLFWLSRSGELCPYLVSEWEFVDSSLVLTLRDDATFHDGSPVDANAVKANLDRVRTMETSAYKAQLRNVESVDVLDDYVVRLNLLPNTGNGIPYSLADFAGMIVNPKYMDPEALKTSAPEAVGSGPYRVASWTPGEANTVLERAGTHWDPAAGQAARIEFYTLPDPVQTMNAITTGEMDFTLLGGSSAARAVEQVETDDNLQAGDLMDTFGSTGVWLQERADPIVREAMTYALDREPLADVYEGGAALNNQFYPEGHPLHSSEIDDLTPYDPDRARELIASAPEGSTSVSMAYTESGDTRRLAELIQAQMLAVGIDIQLEPNTANSISEAWFGGQVDTMLQGSAATPYPANLIDVMLFRGGNVWAAPDSALESLNAELSRADDPALSDEERNDIYLGVLKRAAEERWMVVFNQGRNASIASADLVNVAPELPFQYQSLPDIRYIGRQAG